MNQPIILWRLPTACSDESMDRFKQQVQLIPGFYHLVVRDYDNKRLSYEVIPTEPIVTSGKVSWRETTETEKPRSTKWMR